MHADEMLIGGTHVIGIAAGDALSLAHEPDHLVEGEAARILPVVAVDHVGQCPDPARIGQPDRQVPFEINRRDLLALAQVPDRGLRFLGRDPEGDPMAAPAPVEPQDQPRLFRRSAMNMGKDAQ